MRRAIESDPENAEALYNLGVLRRGPNPAESELRLAAELSPLWGYPHRRLGELLAANGRWSEAEESFRQAMALDEDDPSAAPAFRRFLMESGRPEEARDQVLAALKLDPAHSEALELLDDLETWSR